MELFLFICALLTVIPLITSCVLLAMVIKIRKDCKCLLSDYQNLNRSYVDLKEDFQSMLTRQAEISVKSPEAHRKNNWESMKEAFKAPTKVEINERAGTF